MVNFDGEHWTKQHKRKRNECQESDTASNKRSRPFNKVKNFKDLLSPNWVTSDTVDDYLMLLRNHDRSIFIFDTTFYHDLKKDGYEALEKKYKDKKILRCRRIYIPIFCRDHCFLVILDKDKTEILDPQQRIDRRQNESDII